jgi:hypothetical protein
MTTLRPLARWEYSIGICGRHAAPAAPITNLVYDPKSAQLVSILADNGTLKK